MQDDKQYNPSLDEDILQGKADLREALNALGKPIHLSAGSDPASDSSNADGDGTFDDDLEDEIFLEAELTDADESLEGILAADNPSQAAKPETESAAVPKPVVFPVAAHIFEAKEVRRPPAGPIRSQSAADPDAAALLEKLKQAAAEADTMKTKLQAADSERQQMQQHLGAFEKQLQEKTQLLDRQKQRMEFLEGQLKHAVVLERAKIRFQQEAQNLADINRELAAEVTHLKQQLSSLKGTGTQLEELQSRLRQNEAALVQQQSLLRQAQETKETLRRELDIARRKEQEQTNALAHTQQQLDTLQSEQQQLRAESEQAGAAKAEEMAAFEGKLSELNERYQQLQTEAEQTQHEYEAFQTQANGEIGILSEKLDALTVENRSLSETVRQLTEENHHLQALSDQHRTFETELTQTRAELDTERQRCRHLQEEQESTEAAMDRLRQEKDALCIRVDELQATEQMLRHRLEQGQQHSATCHDSIRAELSEAEAQIQELKAENRHLCDRTAKLRIVEEHLKHTYAQLRQECESAGKLRREQADLSAALSELQTEKEELAEQLATLQSTENMLQEEIAKLRRSQTGDDRLKRDLDEAQHEIDRLLEQNASLEEQLEQLHLSESIESEPRVPEPVSSYTETVDADESADMDSDSEIPVFNLAEQIMEAHRRSVGGRRQRVAPGGSGRPSRSIHDVVSHYVTPTESAPPSRPQSTASRYLWADQSLTPFQQEILREIVRHDMQQYGHHSAEYPSMNN